MNYEEMSNYEINLAVAKRLMRDQMITYLPQQSVIDFLPEMGVEDRLHIVTSSGMKQKLNFCVYPDQYMQVAIKNKISASWVGSYWSVYAPIDFGIIAAKSDHGSGLGRAICVVFLKMTEAKHVK